MFLSVSNFNIFPSLSLLYIFPSSPTLNFMTQCLLDMFDMSKFIVNSINLIPTILIPSILFLSTLIPSLESFVGGENVNKNYNSLSCLQVCRVYCRTILFPKRPLLTHHNNHYVIFVCSTGLHIIINLF